jgi:hypothetical protein
MPKESSKNKQEDRQMLGVTVRFIHRAIWRSQKLRVRGLMVRFVEPHALKPEARAEGTRFLNTKRRLTQLALRASKQGGFFSKDAKTHHRSSAGELPPEGED